MRSRTRRERMNKAGSGEELLPKKSLGNNHWLDLTRRSGDGVNHLSECL